MSSLTENNKSRRALDVIWDAGAIDHCLEAGYWNFAMRTVKLQASTDIEPEFGYRYAFIKPDDYIKTYRVATDEYMNSVLRDYTDEVGHWFADFDELYIQYVSNGSEYGGSLGDFPPSFARYVEAYLADGVVDTLTNDANKAAKVKQVMGAALQNALGKDAANQPTETPKHGKWATARMGSRQSDRYNRNG